MGLAGIAMAGIQRGNVDLIPRPAELPSPSTPCFEVGVDFDSGIAEGHITDGQNFKTNTAMDCWSMCKLERSCMGFAWSKPTSADSDTWKYGCWLKKAIPGQAFPQKRNNKTRVIGIQKRSR